MKDDSKKLAEILEELQRTLLALETYMAQVRDVVARARVAIEAGSGGDTMPKSKGRPLRSKRTAV